MEKQDLIIDAASQVHEDWCRQEYKGFWTRAKEIYGNGNKNLKEVLAAACYKGDTKRNEIVIDNYNSDQYNSKIANMFNNFEDFMFLVKKGVFEIKRFTQRDLTPQEQQRDVKTGNYKVNTSEENILRDFRSLSSSSKKENLEASISAYTVFDQFSKAGITVEQMKNDNNIRYNIGVAIHTDWLKRNRNHSDNSLKVSYEELDSWTKAQDLTVFDALLEVAQKNNVVIAAQEGYKLPDYLAEEQVVLEEIKNKKM